MILKKEFNILKKPYLPPRIEFEEIEADEREMLMISQDDANTPNPPPSPYTDPDLPPPPTGASLDLDFSMDFVINDEPQL